MEARKAFNNSSLKCIVNVYQLQYKNGCAQGLGDYIRGCFCLLQLAILLGIEFDMDIANHPMAKYIQKGPLEKEHTINYKEISRYENINYIPINSKSYRKNSGQFLYEFVNNMNLLKPPVENYYTFCNSFPIFEHYSPDARSFIRNKLQPNELLVPYIEERMKLLELSFKQFGVIHIRSGDKYLLKNKGMNPLIMRKIMNIVSKYIQPGKKILLLSDNNQIKFALKRLFPQIIIHISSIVHLGEQADKSEAGLIDTLVDFYIMSNASRIISCSPYNWGSGFSQWCSILYNIPFFQFQVTDTLS
jgi:hypothetical protein